MTKQAKIHTIELTEQELARALFVMRNVNGWSPGRSLSSIAVEKLGAKEVGFDVFHSKAVELAKEANIPTFINYYAIQKEWETFLGIIEMDKETLGRITELERKLAELKGGIRNCN